ncbi:hypothetical protein DOY81_009957 [Sarcophaga bullata]|nr:hypothetical protein DOY81_009957 [Sarcophaga bullata]
MVFSIALLFIVVLPQRRRKQTSTYRFVTEKNSHKYQSLKADPKVSVTMVLNMPNEIWQIRLFNAEAVELPNEALKSLWQEEPLFAKMRSVVCECGRPNEGVEELECRYQELYKQYESEGKKEPEQTETYTAFKIIPKHWDFYFSEPNKIADRVQYKQVVVNETNKWKIYHADA